MPPISFNEITRRIAESDVTRKYSIRRGFGQLDRDTGLHNSAHVLLQDAPGGPEKIGLFYTKYQQPPEVVADALHTVVTHLDIDGRKHQKLLRVIRALERETRG